MADISLTTPSKSRSAAAVEDPAGREPYWDLIELLFFAYRDFVGDPDQVLDKLRFGGPTTAFCISSIAIPA